MRQLWRHLGRTQRQPLLVLLPAGMFVAALDLLLIVSISQLVRVLMLGGGVPIQVQVLTVLALGWGLAVARSLYRQSQYQLAAQISRQLGDQVLKRLLAQPYGFHLQRDRSDYSALLLQQLPQFSGQVVIPTVQGLGNLATVLLLCAGLWLLAGPAALVVIGLLVLAYALLGLAVKGALRRWNAEKLALELAAQALVVDALAGIRSLLLQGAQAEVRRRYGDLNRQIASLEGRSAVLPELPRQLVEPVGLTLLLLLLLLPMLRSSGAQSLPWLALVTVGMLRLAQPLQELWRGLNLLQGSLPLQQQVVELLNLPMPAVAASTGQLELRQQGPDRGVRLEARELWLRYPQSQDWVLQGLDLELAAGERVGLVGASGSGKSSLATALLGLLAPQRGELWIDGVALDNFASKDKLAAWQAQCGEVAQPVRLLRGSVAENVACWQRGVAEEQIWAALALAQLDGEVRALPAGLHTRLGEDGLRLSGGQCQRLGLARALLARPRFLVLDEATSALDPRTDAAVLRSLDRLQSSTTILVIAHRPATMRRCSRLLLLQNGQIKNQGSYAELLKRSVDFRRLIELTRP